MAVIAPSILVAIFHWVPTPSGAPHSTKFAAYTIGALIEVIFVLLNSISKVLSTWGNINVYDPIWFQSARPIQLVLIHLNMPDRISIARRWICKTQKT